MDEHIHNSDLDNIVTPSNVKTIIANLRFISKIEPGKKVNVKQMFVRDNTLLWQRFLRSVHNWFYSGDENKEATLRFIEKVTDEAIEHIYHYQYEKNTHHDLIDILIRNLERSKHGTLNLMKTYEDDISFVSRIEAYIESLDISLHTLRNEYERRSSIE